MSYAVTLRFIHERKSITRSRLTARFQRNNGEGMCFQEIIDPLISFKLIYDIPIFYSQNGRNKNFVEKLPVSNYTVSLKKDYKNVLLIIECV